MQDIITLGALVLAMWLLYWLQERRERRLVEAENAPLDLTVMFKRIDPGAHVLEVGLSAGYSVTGTPVIPAAGGAWQGVALIEDGHPFKSTTWIPLHAITFIACRTRRS